MNIGYNRINSNAEGIYFYYRIKEGSADIVSVLHAITGEEFSVEQYKNIIAQIKNNFGKQGVDKIQLLSLIFSNIPNNAKHLCLEEDDHWIIDINTNQLIVYETQSADFMGFRAKIENILTEEAMKGTTWGDTSVSGDMYNKRQKTPVHRLKLFTPMNSAIIIINIIIHLIIHFTGLFGGTQQIMIEGALSWQFISQEGEYYRLLTSMFMHFNLGHLFNNMLVLFFIGEKLERAAGKKKHIFLYFGSGIIAGLASIGYNMIQDKVVISVGASGAVFGVVGAMLYILIVNKGRLEDMTSRRMIFFVFLSLYSGFTSVSVDNAAHIGGVIAGFILAFIFYRRPKKVSDVYQHAQNT